MKAALTVLLAALALTGCDQLAQQQSKRSEEKGQEAADRGKFVDALRHYESALDGTAATAEVHYKMALIHDDRLRDPIGAMHHFQRYLELDPRGRWAKDAKVFLQEDQLKAITALASGPLLTSQDSSRLRNENLKLRKEVTMLEAKVKALRERNEMPPAQLALQTDKPPAGARYYTVEPGDTLAAIARKFYNSTARWKDLQDANYNQLGGKVDLKPGMKLIIPK